MASQRILFVFSSVSHSGSLEGDKTGWHLPEAAHPYYELSRHKFTIDFATPAGLRPLMDPASKELYQDDEECMSFLEDSKIQSRLEKPKDLKDVNSDDYISVYYAGGRGSAIDLPIYDISVKLGQKFINSGKLVGAVSHGPAALANVARDDGVSIFNGKEATAYSNVEEHRIGRHDDIRFSVEDRIVFLGGTYVKAKNPWDPKVVCSGNLITGQNPTSARPLAQKMREVLQKSNA